MSIFFFKDVNGEKRGGGMDLKKNIDLKRIQKKGVQVGYEVSDGCGRNSL